jgi:phenylacetate-CoA ligase
MAVWGLAELVRHVRARSPFYRRLYRDLPERVASVAELPVPKQEEYWKANGLQGNELLTGPMRDGVVFKSGGTTGNPKFSVFSREEWEVFCAAFGRGIAATGLRAGDRVANLFYGGELYGSLLFINKSLELSPVGVLQLPIGGSASPDETLRLARDFGANVLAGVPTTILNLAERAAASGLGAREFRLERVLFGGEALYDDQRARLAQVFPGVEARSIGYASTDAGLVGYADRTCAPGEHRVFDGDTVVEILDEETLRPIDEPGREGLIHVTNLTRALMPVLRYPVGDRGAWREPPGTPDRKYALLGRSEEAARVGLVKLYVDDVRRALAGFKAELELSDFQMIVVHHDLRDGLVLRVAAGAGAGRGAAAERITAELHRMRPLYEQFVREAKIHPIRVEWARPGELETNPRTGKLKRVVDRRGSAAGGN